MFRVINEDISTCEHKDIIDEFNDYGFAMQCTLDNYYFNTSIEKLVDGKWKTIAINGESVESIRERSDINEHI